MLHLTFCALTACLPFLPPSPSEGLTPEHVARIASVGAAVLSPDGAHVAYTRSVPRTLFEGEDGAPWSELHVIELSTGAQRPFVTGEVNVRAIAWTPDSQGIAFLDKRKGDEHAALYVIPLRGGEARKAVELEKRSIAAFSLAPDGRRAALRATAPKGERDEKYEKQGFKQEVYEEDWRPDELWIAGLFDDQAEPRRVELAGSVYQVEWSPVDERVAVSIAPTALVDDSYMRQRAWVVDAASGAVLARIENPGKFGSLSWSKDGARLALVCGADVHDPSPERLMVADAASGELTPLFPDDECSVVQAAWQDAHSLVYVAHRGVWSALEKVAPGAAAPEVLVGTGGPILHSLSLSDDGRSAAFVADTPGHPREVYWMRQGDAEPRRLTDSNPWLAELRLAPQEVVRYRARDGLELEGLLIRPLEREGAQPGERVPLVLQVHGGPESHHSNGWLTAYSQPGQVAAARGMAVFYPNYRGSTGRGVAFAKSSQGDPAGKEFDDLIDAVDHLVAEGLVDERRVGVTGGSYGGYATAWCSTRYSERFAAGVMFVGIADKLSKVGTTDIADEDFYVHTLRRPWEDWQFFLERSPIYHADGARTPLLILHGKEDPRVDPGQSRELYRHLKLRGTAPVRLVYYPGEGHGNRQAASRYDYSLRSLQWLEHYLSGPGGAMPPFEIDYRPEEPEEAPEPAPEPELLESAGS
jgi:dipeptidyl aminopeptidase/acylaminoacyl peptidase